MSVDEILSQLDRLFDEGRTGEVEGFLQDHYNQAIKERDYGCALSMLNELIGYYREMTMSGKAKETVDNIVNLIEQAGYQGTIEAGTSYVNVANAYRLLGQYEESKRYYEMAAELYEKLLTDDDMRLAGLYNNMSNLFNTTGDYEAAKNSLESALAIVSKHEDKKIPLAVTYTNLGQAYINMAQKNMECQAEDTNTQPQDTNTQLQDTNTQPQDASAKLQTALEAAKQALSQAEELFDKYGHPEGQAYMDSHYCGMANAFGTLYTQTGQYNLAMDYYEKALLNIYDTAGLTANYKVIYDNYIDVCRMAGAPVYDNMLDLCQAYYEKYGKPMLEEKFPECVREIAVGLAGEGSECFGFADDISLDHDCGPGFAMWMSDEIFAQIGQQLNEEYAKLPRIFAGRIRSTTDYGSGRTGACTVDGFYERILGTAMIPAPISGMFLRNPAEVVKKARAEAENMWVGFDEASLACATNGRIFTDPTGEFSRKRSLLNRYYPEPVWLRKLAQSLTLCAQTGQYNYGRMMARGEYVTARICVDSYVKELMQLTFLLNKKYAPYYKWTHRAMKNLERLPELAYIIEAIYDMPNQKAAWENYNYTGEPNPQDMISQTIEIVAKLVVNELNTMGLTTSLNPYLEVQGQEVMQYMERNELIDSIVETEWRAFDLTRNEGGRASCQNDWPTFSIMRKSQYMTWPDDMLAGYLEHFLKCFNSGRNLITEKYGRMMESTAPDEYAKIKDAFPEISPERKQLADMIIAIQVGWMETFAAEYPKLAGNARSIHTSEDNEYNTSYETYLRGELGTYSDELFGRYGQFIIGLAKEGKNLAYLTMQNTASLYGYDSLDAAEAGINK